MPAHSTPLQKPIYSGLSGPREALGGENYPMIVEYYIKEEMCRFKKTVCYGWTENREDFLFLFKDRTL